MDKKGFLLKIVTIVMLLLLIGAIIFIRLNEGKIDDSKSENNSEERVSSENNFSLEELNNIDTPGSDYLD